MTKLCPRGKAAAKRKFKVYPSAYANAYASKICAGKIKDPSGTKRKDFRGPKPAGAQEGTFVQKPRPPFRDKRNVRRSQNLKNLEYQKKKKAYDILTGNENKRPRPKRFKKGKAIMIVIGIGKKKKVDRKMGGGMTAGSMSGMGRLQKARMMNKGGESKSEMQVKAGREKAKKVIGKLKNFKNQSKGFLKEMAGFEKGGGADTGKAGERTSKRGVARDKMKRVLRGDIEGSIAPYKTKKKMGGGMMKYNKGGDAKIKKVITGLNKASALHKAQAKSLQTVVGKSVGGMADYYKDLM